MEHQDASARAPSSEPGIEGVRRKRMVDQVTDHRMDADDDDFSDIPKGHRSGLETNLPVDVHAEDDEEEDDDDEDDDDDDDTLKGMGFSREERKRLMKMPELERELELTRRTAADDDAVFMKQLVARSGRLNKDVSQPEGRDVRRSERKQASATRQNPKLESLKEMKASRARQEQKQVIDDEPEQWHRDFPDQQEEQIVRKRQQSPPVERDSVEEGAEEGSGQVHERGASNEPNDEEIEDVYEPEESEAGQEQVVNMQVTRSNLEDWIKHPHLQQTLKGAIVRVASNPGARSMWIIDDVVDGDSYQFGSTQRLYCDKHLRIQSPAGDRIDTIPFSVVSNSWVSMDEYHDFHEERAKAKVPQITKHEAASVLAQLQYAREYTLSTEDINCIVRDRKAKGLVKKPLNVQRAELILERQAAEERGDEGALQRVSVKLDEVLAKIKMKQQEQAEDDRIDKQLAQLDKKAAMANRTRASGKGDRAQGAAKNDPYSRKRTIEKVYWSTGQKNTFESAEQDAVHVEESQEEELSRRDQLMSWHLPLPIAPLSRIECMQRRVLGKVGRFSPADDREGKTTISIETYLEMVQHANFSEMGLD